MPDHQFLFALKISDQPRFDAMLDDLAECVLEHVGYAPPAIADILGTLRGALEQGAAEAAASATSSFAPRPASCSSSSRKRAAASGAWRARSQIKIEGPPYPMRLYNTLTRSEETFAPSNGNTVRMYTCGLTVYARGHIGNFRTFVCIDVLRRTLKYLHGHDVRQVMNFTDIDDRTIRRRAEGGDGPAAYTEQYIAAFREDARALGLEEVEENPRATDEANLRAMAELVSALTRNGHTYVSDGSIYFKISTMPDYGRLAHLDKEGMKDGARVDSDNYAKDDARDFVLWKASKPGEPSWDVVDPPGRPGWHLECSAMALRLLGEPPIDIHSGGIDLIFPASRKRDRAERGRDEQAVFALLGARRISPRQRREDVQVARQHAHHSRTSSRAAIGRPPSGICCCRRTTGSS